MRQTARLAALLLAVTPSTLSLPIDVAVSQGYFAAEGLSVRVLDCNTGARCMQQMFDHQVQVVTATELPAVLNSFERADYAIVGTFASSVSNIRLIGRRSGGVAEARQLAGKRVGVLLGSSSHYFLDAYMLFYGLDPKGIRIQGLQPENVNSSMQQHEIDAFAGHSRHTFPLLKAMGSDAAVLSDARIYTETYNLIVDRTVLQQRRADIVKLLRAVDRAEQFIAQQPQRAKEILHQRTKLDPADIEAIYGGFSYRLRLEQSLVSTMEGQARWALREGHVTGNRKLPNLLDYVDGGPLRDALGR